MENENKSRTHVRYGVHYNDRNYEYALHSGKGKFLRNLADVLNVIEYCVSQDLKQDLYKPSEKLYNIDVVRFVNDQIDENFNERKVVPGEFNDWVKGLVNLIVGDNIQRNS